MTLREGCLNGALDAVGRHPSRDLPVACSAADCHVPDADGPLTAATRVYLAADGVKVPLVTDAEKQTPRAKVKQNKRRRCRKCRPQPKAKLGADQRYQEFKLVLLLPDPGTLARVRDPQRCCLKPSTRGMRRCGSN